MSKFRRVGEEYVFESADKKYYLTIEQNNTVSILEQDKSTKQYYPLLSSMDVSEFTSVMREAVSTVDSYSENNGK